MKVPRWEWGACPCRAILQWEQISCTALHDEQPHCNQSRWRNYFDGERVCMVFGCLPSKHKYSKMVNTNKKSHLKKNKELQSLNLSAGQTAF